MIQLLKVFHIKGKLFYLLKISVTFIELNNGHLQFRCGLFFTSCCHYKSVWLHPFFQCPYWFSRLQNFLQDFTILACNLIDNFECSQVKLDNGVSTIHESVFITMGVKAVINKISSKNAKVFLLMYFLHGNSVKDNYIPSINYWDYEFASKTLEAFLEWFFWWEFIFCQFLHFQMYLIFLSLLKYISFILWHMVLIEP